MSNPSTVNKAAEIVASILKGAIEGLGEPALIALILSQTPELVAVPIIGELYTDFIKWIVGQIDQKIYEEIAKFATSAIIDIQVNGEKSQVLNAWQNLQMAIASGDQNALSKARSDMDEAYLSLGHYDGSYSP